MKTRYIRLLSYDNAMKVIDWVMGKDDESYAYITPGGIGVQILDEDMKELETFIKTLTDRYEISGDHPSQVEAKIIENLKRK